MPTQIIQIDTLIQGSKEKLWAYYTDPNHIKYWNFASEDWHCPKVEIDLKVGGYYKARMEAKNGEDGFDFVAVFDEIIPFEKIVYTIEDGRKVVIRFDETDKGIIVQLAFEAESKNPIDIQKAGWQAILNQFKRYASKSN